ncbi:MAG: hypothetical protein IJ011_00290 [Clostridia bacterium]|nr:hypothetical protein [Clostridia bacterium]
MKKKTNLWAAISVLITSLLLIAVFTRGYVLLGLSVVTLVVWTLFVVFKFGVPYINRKLDEMEARQMREYYEAEYEAESNGKDDAKKTCKTLLRHVNYRITNHLKSAYPDAAWEWETDAPEKLVSSGGTGRIKVYNVPDFSHADVTVNSKAELSFKMINVVPMSTVEPTQSGENNAKRSSKDPVDPRIWYEQKARVVLDNLISDLGSRGYSNLSITEEGNVIIQQADRTIIKAKLEAMPDRFSWDRLSKVLQSEGLVADITDDALNVSW